MKMQKGTVEFLKFNDLGTNSNYTKTKDIVFLIANKEIISIVNAESYFYDSAVDLIKVCFNIPSNCANDTGYVYLQKEEIDILKKEVNIVANKQVRF